jgi:hypothetical protein
MISQRAKTGLEKLFPQYLEESLKTELHSSWNIQKVDVKKIDVKNFVMLTISSYDFRLIVLLHFSADNNSLKYVSDSLKIPSDELSLTRYHDYLSEIGNILCGTLKRGLFQFFPHLGMSTPNKLGNESLKYVESYPIDHAIHIHAKARDEVEFFGSLYVSSIGELDFDPATISKNEEKVEMGALEMF